MGYRNSNSRTTLYLCSGLPAHSSRYDGNRICVYPQGDSRERRPRFHPYFSRPRVLLAQPLITAPFSSATASPQRAIAPVGQPGNLPRRPRHRRRAQQVSAITSKDITTKLVSYKKP